VRWLDVAESRNRDAEVSVPGGSISGMTTVNQFEQVPHGCSIGSAIQQFTEEVSAGRTPATAQRYSRLGAELLRFTESAADRFLTGPEQLLVHGAREVGEIDPVRRLIDAESLGWALPGYLRRCLDESDADPRRQRDRAAFIGRLLTWLLRRGLLDSQENCCMVLELRAQLRRLRAQGSAHPSTRRSA
jgi:hypothetical protein